jgi:Ca2+-binding RTX toxin-like protein
MVAAAWLCAALLSAPPALAPAAAPARACAGLKPTLVGTAGDDVLVSKRRDVIWAGPGDDVIRGGGGNDVICAGPGDDRVYAGRGFDRVYGGGGDDLVVGQQGADDLRGGRGDDTLLGRRGSDRLRGGGGRDTLLGGAGNDRIGGGASRDVLVGGAGDDRLDGGGGDADHVYGGLGADRVGGGPGDFDLVRGDAGHDLLDGGPGRRDIASFATASPPGADALGLDGVHVDLRRGIAYGDGFGLGPNRGVDRLRRVEDAIGSPFDDRFVAGPGNRIEGGFGRDQIVGGAARVSAAGARGQPDPRTTYVGFAASIDGRSALHVVGSSGPDRIEISAAGRAIVIADPAGLTVGPARGPAAGTGCALSHGGAVATCVSAGGIDTLAVNGLGGDDELAVRGSVPRTLAAYLDGGHGDDAIRGGPGDDFLHGGPSGADRLAGGGGDDSLQSDSGGAVLRGGPGDDLLVVSRPCGGEDLRGGAGKDRVGFNPAPHGVFAAIGGRVEGGGGCRPGRVAADVEGLEGSRHADTLIGDGGPNSLAGRRGDDLLLGRGGPDELEGGPGADTCDGGAGRDRGASCEAARRIP